MVKQLDQKINELQAPFFETFRRFSSVDLLQDTTQEPLERNFGLLEDVVYGYRQWKLHYATVIETYEEKFGPLIDAYFKEKQLGFEVMIMDILKEKAFEKGARELSAYINDLAKALILRFIEVRAIRLMINLSSNQF